jgi:fructokinase
MAVSTTPVVVGLGELLWDCFGETRRPGGAPANVAFHADQLGCRGVVCSRVGSDPLGDEFAKFLADQGLTTDYLQRDPERPTGRATVDDSAPGHPEFTIHEDVAWDALAFTPECESLMRSAAAVCFGTLAQRSERTRETVHRCLEATAEDCLRVYDVNLRQDYYRREWVERSLESAKAVKLNEHESTVLAAQLEFPRPDTDDAESLAGFARRLSERYGLDLVCVTRADRGCVLVSGDEVAVGAGRPVDVVDSVGAGDAFTAALIVSRLRRWPLGASAEFANAVGGLVASRAGAMPPLREELSRLAAEFGPT